MLRNVVLSLMCSCLIGPTSAAAEGQEEKEPAAAPPKPGTALRLTVVYTRHQGERKVSSLPYTLLLNAGVERPGLPSRLRMGLQVPLKVKDADGPGNIVFKDVSNNIDCSASERADSRFDVRCTIEQSSVYQAEEHTGSLSISSTPVLRIFRADESFSLRDGQTTQFATATDPVSGDVLKVDVTLNVVK